ncbi:general secretion pathway protein B [Serratia fonticola]|uniref:General secretion pathway protein B n=1 Tax=Serratia fonticola TaxID=47917 RepID=A0A559TCX1_SERFO|nr:general secretion pathway protein B [Serratia fonticola]TQI97959.1 general secretion pathway protein B [Serratia fonticola]TVZ72454.1 general secretion pathway protein B [Serratia fonticola]
MARNQRFYRQSHIRFRYKCHTIDQSLLAGYTLRTGYLVSVSGSPMECVLANTLAVEISVNQRFRDVDNQSKLAPEAHIQPAKGLFVPRYLLPVYALLLIAIGWFCGQHWRSNEAFAAPTQTQTLPSAAAKATKATPTAKNAGIKPPHDENKPAQPLGTEKQSPPSLASDELAPLRYSAHVYASEDDKRSITLNGHRYQEGDSPAPNLTIEQIQQDVTVFNFNGEVFTLDALEDWPGGKVDKESNALESE